MWTEYTLKDLGVYNQILNGTEKKHFLMYVCTYIHAYKHTHTEGKKMWQNMNNWERLHSVLFLQFFTIKIWGTHKNVSNF